MLSTASTIGSQPVLHSTLNTLLVVVGGQRYYWRAKSVE